MPPEYPSVGRPGASIGHPYRNEVIVASLGPVTGGPTTSVGSRTGIVQVEDSKWTSMGRPFRMIAMGLDRDISVYRPGHPFVCWEAYLSRKRIGDTTLLHAGHLAVSGGHVPVVLLGAISTAGGKFKIQRATGLVRLTGARLGGGRLDTDTKQSRAIPPCNKV